MCPMDPLTWHTPLTSILRYYAWIVRATGFAKSHGGRRIHLPDLAGFHSMIPLAVRSGANSPLCPTTFRLPNLFFFQSRCVLDIRNWHEERDTYGCSLLTTKPCFEQRSDHIT